MGKAIKPHQPVQAVLSLPGSKSYTHRTLVAASLAAGESLLSNALKAEDTELTAQALAKLGAGHRLAGRRHPGPGRRRPLAAGL